MMETFASEWRDVSAHAKGGAPVTVMVPQSRGIRLLSRSIVAWIALAGVVVVSVMAFMQFPQVAGAELARGAIAIYWVFLAVSLALHGRAYLALDESRLLIQGRLRRRMIDPLTIQKFEDAPYAFDTWSALMLPRWLGTMHAVKVVYTDGSEMVIGSVLGSDLDCRNLSHRLNRRLRALGSTAKTS